MTMRLRCSAETFHSYACHTPDFGCGPRSVERTAILTARDSVVGLPESSKQGDARTSTNRIGDINTSMFSTNTNLQSRTSVVGTEVMATVSAESPPTYNHFPRIV